MPALGFFQEQHGQRQQKTRRGRDVERKAPSIVRSQIATQQIARRRSDRDRQIKNPKDPPAPFLREQIGDKSRRDGHEGRFANPHQRVPDQQFRVGMGKRCEQCERAPEHRAKSDDELARIAIRERPHKGRGHHIKA